MRINYCLHHEFLISKEIPIYTFLMRLGIHIRTWLSRSHDCVCIIQTTYSCIVDPAYPINLLIIQCSLALSQVLIAGAGNTIPRETGWYIAIRLINRYTIHALFKHIFMMMSLIMYTD